MNELTDPGSRWHRSLWTVALVTILDEVIEVTEHTWSGVLNSEHALNDLKASARRACERDHGLGSETLRKKVLEDINGIKPNDNPSSQNAILRMHQWRDRIARNYLRNWASYIEDQSLEAKDVELCARSIVTHLRSLGYSRSHLQGWVENRSQSLSLSELIREAARNLNGNEREYVFVVASNELASLSNREKKLATRDLLIEPHRFHTATNKQNFDLSILQASKGVEIRVAATDPHAALARLQLRLERIWTRFALAEGKIKQFPPSIVLETGANKLWATVDPNKLISIPALRDWKLILALEDLDETEVLTETLHLLSPQLQIAHGVSLATLWASCEALLGRRQQGGHLVAPRLAAILACAYPRQLAWDLLQRARTLKKSGTILDCRTKGSNTQAFKDFWEDIVDHDPGFSQPEDRAAYYRFISTIQTPKATLKRVRNHLEELLLRLYYHRNFVMHSAKTNSVSLSDVASVAPTIVAAAINELISGVARGIKPSALAERAVIEMELLETDAGKPLNGLLG
ncbi:hypothetical protein [Humidisolicoccus flavus]|uniref:hypothetical protein n=1 Tax=Humidisolicoccus flavus TaxID=3111414 RepID=UPI00324B4D4C